MMVVEVIFGSQARIDLVKVANGMQQRKEV